MRRRYLEVISEVGNNHSPEAWKSYRLHAHTTTKQLAEIANEIEPQLLVLNHVGFLGQTPEQLIGEVSADYSGRVVLAQDLDIYK